MPLVSRVAIIFLIKNKAKITEIFFYWITFNDLNIDEFELVIQNECMYLSQIQNSKNKKNKSNKKNV